MNGFTSPELVQHHQDHLRSTANHHRLVKSVRRTRRAAKRQSEIR